MSACYGIRVEEITRRCGVSLKTALRWKRGTTQIPKTAEMILSDDLGALDPAWWGWALRDGRLVSGEGWEVAPGDVLAIPLMRSQIAAYQAKERELLALEEQPLPGDLPMIASMPAVSPPLDLEGA